MTNQNYSLIIAITVKKGYDLQHYIRLTKNEVEFVKLTLHLTSIEDIVKSFIKHEGYEKIGYYKYNNKYLFINKYQVKENNYDNQRISNNY